MADRAPSFQLDPDSHKAMRQAMEFTERTTRYDSAKILTFAGVAFAVSARKRTPSARKNKKRKIVDLRQKSNRRSEAKRFGALVLSQSASPRVVPVVGAGTVSEAKAADVAAVPRVGTAKLTWNGVMRRLGKAAAAGGPAVGDARMIRPNSTAPALEITNDLSYLLKIAPNIEAESMGPAARQMVIRTDLSIERAWRRKK